MISFVSTSRAFGVVTLRDWLIILQKKSCQQRHEAFAKSATEYVRQDGIGLSGRRCSENVPLLRAKGWLQASRQDENVVELVRHEDVVVIGNQCWRG